MFGDLHDTGKLLMVFRRPGNTLHFLQIQNEYHKHVVLKILNVARFRQLF